MPGVLSGRYNLGLGGVGPGYPGAPEEDERNPFAFKQSMLGPSAYSPEAFAATAARSTLPPVEVPDYSVPATDAYNEATEYGATDPMNPSNFTLATPDKKIAGPQFKKAPSKLRKKGKAALQAVAQPSDGDAIFFVARGNGAHYFSATYAEHSAAVRKYQLRR